MKKGERKRTQDVDVNPPDGALAVPPENGKLARFSDDVPLAYIARQLGGPVGLINMARYAPDMRSQQVVKLWDALPEIEKKDTAIETLCQAANISPAKFLGTIVEGMHSVHADTTKLIAIQFSPEVLRRTAEVAMTEEGHRDRKMFLQSTGILPTPRGATQVFNFGSGPPDEPKAVSAPTDAGIPRLEETTDIEIDFEEI